MKRPSTVAARKFNCERGLIKEAFNLNHTSKMLVTVIDDAHLMDIENLRKLRLLFEDFPKCYWPNCDRTFALILAEL